MSCQNPSTPAARCRAYCFPHQARGGGSEIGNHRDSWPDDARDGHPLGVFHEDAGFKAGVADIVALLFLHAGVHDRDQMRVLRGKLVGERGLIRVLALVDGEGAQTPLVIDVHDQGAHREIVGAETVPRSCASPSCCPTPPATAYSPGPTGEEAADALSATRASTIAPRVCPRRSASAPVRRRSAFRPLQRTRRIHRTGCHKTRARILLLKAERDGHAEGEGIRSRAVATARVAVPEPIRPRPEIQPRRPLTKPADHCIAREHAPARPRLALPRLALPRRRLLDRQQVSGCHEQGDPAVASHPHLEPVRIPNPV